MHKALFHEIFLSMKMKLHAKIRRKVKDLTLQMKEKMDNRLEWRRTKVLELSSKGQSQVEIARILQISEPTISRDFAYLRQQAKSNIRKYIDERLPEEYEKCLVGLTAILREAWNTSQQTEDNREKIQALSLAKGCYSMKLDLLTNTTVVDDAIRFVSQSKEKLISSCISSNEDYMESNEPDYDEDGDHLEEKQEEWFGGYKGGMLSWTRWKSHGRLRKQSRYTSRYKDHKMMRRILSTRIPN
jgi:predicted transcriptional regulator